MPVDERLIQVGPYSPDVPLAPTRQLLESEDRPTAIFASSDVSGLAAMELAAQLGLSVPADLSLVGFDNTGGTKTRVLSRPRDPGGQSRGTAGGHSDRHYRERV